MAGYMASGGKGASAAVAIVGWLGTIHERAAAVLDGLCISGGWRISEEGHGLCVGAGVGIRAAEPGIGDAVWAESAVFLGVARLMVLPRVLWV